MTLLGHKDAGIVATEVIMTRQLHGGSFLIVEGEDDHKFWSPRVAPGQCELVIGNGKPNVEGAINRLDRSRFRGALGVVDDDFDGLTGRSRPSPNLIATDTHDLECTLIRSPALERVLAELGSAAKIRALEERQGSSIRDGILEPDWSSAGCVGWHSAGAGRSRLTSSDQNVFCNVRPGWSCGTSCMMPR